MYRCEQCKDVITDPTPGAVCQKCHQAAVDQIVTAARGKLVGDQVRVERERDSVKRCDRYVISGWRMGATGGDEMVVIEVVDGVPEWQVAVYHDVPEGIDPTEKGE